MRRRAAWLTRLALALSAAGCGDAGEASHGPRAKVPPELALAAEPAGAPSVRALIKTVTAADGGTDATRGTVTVFGRVGDVDVGRAAFVLADTSLASCDEMVMPVKCATPWDFCCTPPPELRKLTLRVELRTGDAPIPGDLLGWNRLDHLKTVVIQGRAIVDPNGAVTVVASGVFVRAD